MAPPAPIAPASHDLDEASTQLYPLRRGAPTAVVERAAGRRRITGRGAAAVGALLAVVGAAAFGWRRAPAHTEPHPANQPAAAFTPEPDTKRDSPADADPAPALDTVSPAEAARLLARGDLDAARDAYATLARLRPGAPELVAVAMRLNRIAADHCARLRAEGTPCK